MIVERLQALELAPETPEGSVSVAPCLLFIDEVHAMAKPVMNVLLSALDDRRTTTIDNTVYGFERVVFLLATTDPGLLSEAFLSRLQITRLEPYTLYDIAGIVWLHAKDLLEGVELPRDVCVEIGARMQCSPRESVKVLDELTASFYTPLEERLGRPPSRREVAASITLDSVEEWFSFVKGADRNGLGANHLSLLRLLDKRGAVSEEEIKRALGIYNKPDFVNLVEYGARLGLLRVGAGGRSLTPLGRRYLREGDKIDLRDQIARRFDA